MKRDDLIVVRGGGDLATGVVHRLWSAGLRVLVLETSHPAAIRRQVSLCEAVYEGETAVEAVETRVAVIAIIVRDGTQVAALNDLLHQYGPYIVGRMGVPYREKGVNIISVAMDAPGDVISALSGKLGRLEGVTAKTVYAPAGSV